MFRAAHGFVFNDLYLYPQDQRLIGEEFEFLLPPRAASM